MSVGPLEEHNALYAPCWLRLRFRRLGPLCNEAYQPLRQLGNGFRDEFLNARINSRTPERRSSNLVRSLSNSSTAELYHSVGICSTSCQSELSGKLSIRFSQGPK